MLTEAIVASVIAGSSVCSDHFDNHSRFNPTALSDYQQCVLAAHSDETAGVLGSIFWTKVGETEFVSMPVQTLRSAGSQAAAQQMVIETILEEVIVEKLVTQVVEVERELTEEQSRAIEFAGNYLTGVGSANSLDSDIQSWLYSRGIPYVGAPNAAAAWEEATTVTEKATVLFNVAKGLDATIEGLPTRNQILFQARRAVDQSVEAINGRIGIEKILGQYRPALTNYESTHTAHSSVITERYTGYMGGSDGVIYASSAEAITNGGWVREEIVNSRMVLTIDGTTIDTGFVYNFGGRLREAVNQAYNKGFDKGYDEGYADGYRDGFRDGVASVS